MKIYHDNSEILDIQLDNNSYRYREIKGDHNLTLYFSLAEHVEIPVGAYCVYQNETYTLEKPESLKMQHSRKFEYTVIFDSPQAKAGKWKFRNPVDRRLKFPLTDKPREHLQMFVDNMNLRDSGWSIGQCIDAPEKTIQYNHAFCIEALEQMADVFETEYEIIGKQVSLWKVEYNRDNPLPLSYGAGNGFKPGVGRSNYEDSIPTEILYVQGGEQNIDWDKYGNKELLLPKSQRIRFDGQHFEDETGFDSTKSKTYITDAEGFSIRRADRPLSSHTEESLDLTEIYPYWEHRVTKAVEVKEGVWDIYAENTAAYPNNSPSNLNYADCRIGGETATVIFQSGMLTGKKFDIVQSANALTGYNYATKKFELVSQQIDGLNMPDGEFIPRVGDKFRVFGIRLPDVYICDNATKSGASWVMFREGVKHLYDNEDQKFSFTGELDGAWAKRDWNNIGGRIKLGGFVQFSDERFQPEGVLVRIIGIKDYINDPHSPEIELSNSTVGRTISSELRKMEGNDVVIEEKHREAIQFTKRRYKDSIETMEMLKGALLDNYTNSINPLTVQTMAALIGDESLQFRFVTGPTSPKPAVHNVIYDTAKKVLSVSAGVIQHLTLGIKSISSSHSIKDYKFWTLPAFETPTLTDADKRYYLYAKVSKTAETGVFRISENAIALEEVTGFYHLLMGVLNSEYDGDRSYVSLYGFTEILPGRIMTDKIVSSDGKTYFDLLNSEIGGTITFSSGSSGLHNLTEWGTAQQQIDRAGQTASNAENIAASAQQAVTDARVEIQSLKSFTDVAFADGVVSRAEAIAIQKYLHTVSETQQQVETAYNTVYANKLLTGAAKTNLKTAKEAFDSATRTLTDSISSAIADGQATPTEREAVDSAYDSFVRAYGVFSTRIEEANVFIQVSINTTAQGAYTLSEQLQQAVNNITGTLLPDLQNQLDGSIASWDGDEVPTLSNYPANEWTNDTERRRHVGDYYDRFLTVDGEKVTERYKFSDVTGVFEWTRVADSGAALASSEAREALGLAGTKAAIFYGSGLPSVPYSINDVWFRSEGTSSSATMTIYICNADRKTGELGADSDWQLVDETQVRLRAMSSDEIISREEKATLRNTLEQYEQNAQGLWNNAAEYGVSATDLRTAFRNLSSFLTSVALIGDDTDTSLTAEQRTLYNQRFAQYTTAAAAVANQIADAISQGKVDRIQLSSRNLVPDSKQITVAATSTNFNFIARLLSVEVEGGEELSLSVDRIEVLAGSPAGFTAAIYNNGHTQRLAPTGQLTSEKRTHTFRIDAGTVRQKAMLLLYAGVYGSTAGNSVRYEGISLVKGNKPMPLWMEAPEDAEARVRAAQQAADTANEAIDAMNDDGVFDIAEKQTIRTQWERISGGVPTSAEPAYADGGSYKDTWAAAAAVKVDQQALVSAFYTLRAALHGVQLYTNTNTAGFDRKNMAAQFTAYHSAELALLNKISEKQAAMAADAIAVSSANLLDNSESRTVTAGAESNYAQTVFKLGAVAVGDQLALSVGNIEVLAGSPAAFTALLYEYSTNRRLDANQRLDTLTRGRRTYVYTVTRASAEASLILYAGQNGSTAGNSVRFDRIMLVRGNKPMLSWSPSNADTAAQIEQVRIQAENLGFLTTAFAEDKTVMSGGLVVGSFLGVKDSEQVVVAGMAGKNFLTGKDFAAGDNSCPMIFAGATSAAEANSAKFRVYTDGAVAMSALIAENGCRIGGFKIFNNALFNEYTGTMNGINAVGSVGLYDSGLIDIRQGLGSSGNYSYLYMGFPNFVKTKDGRIPALSIDITNSYHAGLLLDVPAGVSAIEIPSGCIRGFRRSMKYVISSVTLTPLDDVIVANNSSAITITLPSAPQNGEDFEILKNSGTGQITVSGNGKQIVSFGVSVSTSQVLTTGHDFAARLTYSSTLGRWFMRKSNGKLT